MLKLNDKQIKQKVTRLAYQIIEHNLDEKKIFLAGINKNGYFFASLLRDEIKKIKESPLDVQMVQILLDPALPTESEISTDIPPEEMKNSSIIIVDDVANTGRTLYYAFKPFMKILIKKLKVLVLVDRQHKSFPISADYIGLELATMLNEHIEVNLSKKGKYYVELSRIS